MSKFIQRKKSCYISFQCKDLNQAREICLNFLKKGYFHFYFKTFENNLFIHQLLALKKIYSNIQIFYVHDSKTPFWIRENLTNLPIFVENKNTDIDIWLNKYCERF